MNPPSLFPLSERNWWLYRTDRGSVAVRVAGREPFGEARCYVMEASIGNEILQQECLEVNEIGIWLHARRVAEELLRCDPPYPLLRLPLHLGAEWDWRGAVGGEDIYLSFRLDREETVRVPAGTFTAVHVGMGERSALGTATVHRWYAEGIGMVRETSDHAGGRYQAELVDFDVRGDGG